MLARVAQVLAEASRSKQSRVKGETVERKEIKSAFTPKRCDPDLIERRRREKRLTQSSTRRVDRSPVESEGERRPVSKDSPGSPRTRVTVIGLTGRGQLHHARTRMIVGRAQTEREGGDLLEGVSSPFFSPSVSEPSSAVSHPMASAVARVVVVASVGCCICCCRCSPVEDVPPVAIETSPCLHAPRGPHRKLWLHPARVEGVSRARGGLEVKKKKKMKRIFFLQRPEGDAALFSDRARGT